MLFSSQLTIALTLALTTLSVQAVDAPISTEHEKCVDAVDLGALKNTQFAKCDMAELARQDVVLNSTYSQLKAKLSKEQQSALLTGQRAWLKYRESWCQLEGALRPMGGSGHASCMVQLTADQNRALAGALQSVN